MGKIKNWVIASLVAIALLLTLQLAQLTTQAEIVPHETIWTFAATEVVELKLGDFILTADDIVVEPKHEQENQMYELEAGNYRAYIHNYDEHGVLNIEQVKIIQQ
ncbi:MAG: hypothetical protein ACRC6H_02890 [Culicoidibacterales bacterium]